MLKLRPITAPCKAPAVEVHAFFDRIRCWRREPLTRDELLALDAVCRFELFNEPCLFNSRFRQRVEIYRPGPDALALLARFPHDAMLNYVEAALDIIPPAEADLDRALEFLRNTILLPHHTTAQAQSYRGSFTSRRLGAGRRRAGRWLRAYADRPSKITGAIPCIHIELRYEGRRQVKALGLHHPRDLRNFDFTNHFARKVPVYRLDLERLGRFHSNRQSRSRRQKPRFDSFGGNCDSRTGNIIWRALALDPNRKSRSLQTFVQRFGRGPFLVPYYIYAHSAEPKLFTETPVVRALLEHFHPFCRDC